MAETTQATTGQIQIQFTNATTTANNVSITLGNSGTYQLAKSQPLQFNGTFGFTTLSVMTGVINITNTVSGTSLNGTVTVNISATKDPTITVSNFSGQAMVSWPTSSGQENEQLNSGNALTLSNFTSDD